MNCFRLSYIAGSKPLPRRRYSIEEAAFQAFIFRTKTNEETLTGLLAKYFNNLKCLILITPRIHLERWAPSEYRPAELRRGVGGRFG